MADKGEDYGIQQRNGGNERVTTLETQMPQLSLTDVAVFETEWSKHTGITRYIFTGIYPFIPGLLIILEAALAEAAKHALQ